MDTFYFIAACCSILSLIISVIAFRRTTILKKRIDQRIEGNHNIQAGGSIKTDGGISMK